MAGSGPLKLTDFVDLSILQEIQDTFAAVANVKAVIADADGNVLTQQMPSREFIQRQRSIAESEARLDGPTKAGREYTAPIYLAKQRVGVIRMKPATEHIDDAKLQQLAERFGVDGKQLKSIGTALAKIRDNRPAAIQFLYLLANAIAQLGYQKFLLTQRISELTAVYDVTTWLSEARDLTQVLSRTARYVSEVINAKASSIRLLDEDKDELTIKAVYNLSDNYLRKGPIRFSKAEVDQEALSDAGFAYVPDMSNDTRTQYPLEAQQEGIVSMLSVGMRYKGKPIGVLRVYTDQQTTFTDEQIDLLRAVAAQAAAAIENQRLLQEAIEAEQLDRQIRTAAAVQRRLLPHTPPQLAGIDLAAVYVPCYALGGDFYDFIPLPDDNLGIVVADVSGKGVPASLIMASVRAALRAQVDNVYYLYEVMRRLNVMLCRDTETTEFVTLFYGVIDARSRRLTYCSAGHPPALLLRAGKVTELDTINMVLGVNPDEEFAQSVLELRSGDAILAYTDGLFDAENFDGERFGRARTNKSFSRGGDSADVMANNVLWDMRRFVGISKRTDDVTLVVARAE